MIQFSDYFRPDEGGKEIEEDHQLKKDDTKSLGEITTPEEPDEKITMKAFGLAIKMAQSLDMDISLKFIKTEEFGTSLFLVIDNVPMNGKNGAALVPIPSGVPEAQLGCVIRETITSILAMLGKI